jgi:hypothetical protein
MAEIELTQAILGLEPYVLLTLVMGDEGPDDLRLKVNAGGGITSTDDIRSALMMALESLPGGED